MKLSEPEVAGRKGNWLQLFSGGQYWPADPRAEDVKIIDIAHHLSMLCRYTGAVSRFYSVAEHSWHVSYVVPLKFALMGLLHDAPEFVLNDLNRPVKHMPGLDGYRQLEALNWAAIAERFALPLELPQEVHEADNAMLHVEKAALMKNATLWYDFSGRPDVVRDVVVRGWEPAAAEFMFLRRFYELSARIAYSQVEEIE